MIKIQKEFLQQGPLLNIVNLVKNPNFPLYKSDSLTTNKKDFHFSHIIYENNKGVVSDTYHHFQPVFEALDVQVLVRAKINLTIKEPTNRIIGGYHIDLSKTVDDKKIPLDELKIAILYLNTTNGQTWIKKDNEIVKVDCIENSVVTFPNTLEHTATSHTDTNFRYVLNINYI